MEKKGEWTSELVGLILVIVVVILSLILLKYYQPIKDAIFNTLDKFLNLD